MSLRGSCPCGAVAFHVEEPFAAFQYCHCSRCRKKTGSAHAANAFLAKAQLTWDHGEDQVKRFDIEGSRWSSAFCVTCGGAMPFLNRTGTMYVVPAGSFEGEMTERPTRNIFFGSRAPWYTPASDLETLDDGPK